MTNFKDFLDKEEFKVWTHRFNQYNKKGLLAAKAKRLRIYTKKKKIKKIIEQNIGDPIKEITYIKEGKTTNESFKIKFSDYQLKCYECWTSKHAQKINSISKTLLKNNIPFPKVLLTSKRFVISEWIDGEELRNNSLMDPILLKKFTRYQAQIHNCPYPKELGKNWEEDHYLKFIFSRFVYFGKKHSPENKLWDFCKSVYDLKPELTLKITHPDFTLDNMVLVKNKLVMIDNETLNIDQGYEYDILNSSKILFKGDKNQQEEYIKEYSKSNKLGTLRSSRDFWAGVWKIRLAGNKFQVNQFAKSTLLIKTLKNTLKRKLEDG